MIKLEEETGKVFLSSYGNEFAFGWIGDAEFMTRMENLVFNYGLSTGKGYTVKYNLIKPKFHTIYSGMSYILTSVDRLMAGLTNFYINQVKQGKDYPPEIRKVIYDEEGTFVDVQWEEDVVFDLAFDRAQKYYEEIIIQSNFMYDINSEDAYTYKYHDLAKK